MSKGRSCLHVVTEKGHGFRPAAEDPVLFHAPPQFERQADQVVRDEKERDANLYARRVERDFRADGATTRG